MTTLQINTRKNCTALAGMDENSRLRIKLRRLLRHRGRSREDTEDLIQDAFVRLHAYSITVVVHEREAFLVRTALNLEIDQRRRERYRVFVPEPLEELCLLDDSPSPVEMVEVQERLSKIEQALRPVSRRTRDMYWMNRIEGYSYTQIAKKFDISVSAVEKHMTRALELLVSPRAQNEISKDEDLIRNEYNELPARNNLHRIRRANQVRVTESTFIY